MRLDADPTGIQSNSTPDRAPRDRLICFPMDEADIKLETRPRGTRERWIMSGLAKDEIS